MMIKRFVAKKLHEGVKLSDIQNMLAEELECKMTFLELRLMAAELEDVDWEKFDPTEKKETVEEAAPIAENTVPAAEAPAADEAAPAAAAGKTNRRMGKLCKASENIKRNQRRMDYEKETDNHQSCPW